MTEISLPEAESKAPDLAELHKIGVAMHLLKPASKEPFRKGWCEKPDTLEKLQSGIVSGHNTALQMGKASKTEYGYLHALDADLRDGSKRADLIKALDAALPESDRAYVVETGSGTGQHYFFFAPEPLPSHTIAKGDGWELALKGTGTYVVAPGSIHPSGKRYEWAKGKRLVPATLDLVPPPKVALGPLRKADPKPQAEPAEPIESTELKAALEQLDPSKQDYDSWRTIGMALNYESGAASWASTCSINGRNAIRAPRMKGVIRAKVI
ncbi:bifunctional DNA primase/polymerase [Marivita sp. S2033]|uniref:bifunctional DNA primase/polymerase n=1 Tax=Marivita sp. S2033 TaxID=3373187 RepID=UPI00398257A6